MQGGRKLRAVAVALGLVALSACGSSTTASVSPTPTVPPTYTAYVLDQTDATLTPIPLASGMPGTPFVVGVTNKVWGLAISEDGKTAYVTGAGNITVINLVTRTVMGSIVVDASDFGPIDIALSPDGKMAYVVNYNGYKVTPVTLATGALGTPITVGGGDNHPGFIVITPDGKTAYVVINNVNNITTAADIKGGLIPIDLNTGLAGAELPTKHETGSIALSKDGKTAYAFYLDVNAQGTLGITVTPISLPSVSLGVGMPVGFFVNSLALSPDQKKLYLINQFGNPAGIAPKGGMATLDLASGTVGAVTVLGSHPHAIAIGQDPS